MDTREVIARFEAERQALAMMDHPNIAKVLDAGVIGERSDIRDQRSAGGAADSLTSDLRPLTSGSGRPYFVMELVRGIKITDYCDQEQLAIRSRPAPIRRAGKFSARLANKLGGFRTPRAERMSRRWIPPRDRFSAPA
jgi:serine/threonine protein kinase